MKKGLIIVGSIAVFIFIVFSWATGMYNSMVEYNQEAIQSWADVETQYQRRADLIPNLVNVVKGYANHEKETLTGVVEARAKATSVNIDPSKMSAADIKNFSASQSGLSSALSKLMVVVEKYPDLKANQNFLQLQAQLEGTENRITVARQRFNQTTTMYNKYIKKFPKVIFAGWYGFDERPLFQSTAGSEKAPVVQF